MQILKRFFAAPVFEGDEDKTNRARLLHIILVAQGWVLIVLIVSNLIGTISTGQRNLTATFLLVSVLFVSFIWRYLMQRGQINTASTGLIITFLAGLTIVIVMGGTIRTIGIMFFPIVLIMATILIGKRAGVVFFAISAFIAGSLVVGEIVGFLPLPTANPIDLRSTISVVAGLGLTMVLLYLAAQSTENALKRAIDNEQTVRLLAATLEQSVTDRTTLAESARIEADEAQAALHVQLNEINALSRISEAMRGEQDVVALAQNILRQLCLSLDAHMGAIFIREGEVLRMMGSYAYTRRKNAVNVFRLGEGLVGQAALEKQPIIITNAPADYVSLASGMLEIAPRNIMAIPFQHNGQVIGVIELATLNDFTVAQSTLLERALESIAISFSTAQARTQINALLTQTQQQASELRIREGELKTINQELQAQAKSLHASQDKLRRQQSDLQAANAELEERTTTLQQQRTVLDEQNRELTAAQGELQRQAQELIQANKYKSEFLANMSHELRTPLNSLLILSRMFANNEGGNLSKDQVESAQVIYNSGSDLLSLINEILDLSKVEAGQMTFHFDQMPLKHFAENMRLQFEHLAAEKKLTFEVALAAGLPEDIETDHQRVEQVLKNLLSNAFKFTAKGTVRLLIEPAENEMVAIRVQDSGIGMTPDQQVRVFEAFQQADGSTSRKYGGTGLGLTISREMAARLGGRIGLESVLGKGSTFTLYLPIRQPQAEAAPAPLLSSVSGTATKVEGQPVSPTPKLSAAENAIASSHAVEDDRARFKKGDRLLLVIEDDASFAKVVFDYAHKKGFKCLVASNGEDGLKLAAQHPPDAILLDLHLPGMSGWQVLDTLKGTANLRHIPVHILSASEETTDLYKRGALGFLSKPVSPDGLEHVFTKIGEFLSRDIKSLLLIEDDQNLRHSVRQLLGGRDVKITDAARGDEAIALLHRSQFDCIILDINLPDMTGFEFLSQIDEDDTIPKCPLIVYTGKALSEEENAQLLKYADSVIIKGIKSPERLLDETALFLHRVVADMPSEKQETILRLHDRDTAFSGKHILVVDDDMRNAFALSRLLNGRDLRVTIARSGAKALETLATVTDIDLVLMDIMMPGMDGYETMERVRAQKKFKNLPILALTAKAMKGDLEKCIAAGANDYLSKPIDAERLFSMLRVWLYR